MLVETNNAGLGNQLAGELEELGDWLSVEAPVVEEGEYQPVRDVFGRSWVEENVVGVKLCYWLVVSVCLFIHRCPRSVNSEFSSKFSLSPQEATQGTSMHSKFLIHKSNV